MGGTFTAAGDEDGGDTRVLQNDDEGDGDESAADEDGEDTGVLQNDDEGDGNESEAVLVAATRLK